MAEDLEVGVMLEVDESQLEDVEDRQVDVTGGGGGGSTPAERDQQEQVVAGGVSKGLLATGVIAGILSQLKVITAPIKALFGIISRSLVPVAEFIADEIRSGIEIANEIAAAPGEAAEEFSQTTLGDATRAGIGQVAKGAEQVGLIDDADDILKDRNQENNFTPEEQAQEFRRNLPGNNSQSISQSEFLAERITTDTSKTADQSGEANKEQTKNIIEDVVNDVLGGGNS